MTRLGEALPEIRITPPGPESRSLAKRLRRVESRNVTFVCPAYPVFWKAAHGANVVDADGNVLLDLTAAFGVALLGHTSPDVAQRIAAQSTQLVHGMGDVHPPAAKVELLERLQILSPWIDGKAVLASSGSEAVEIALKTALLATGRPGILAFEGGYHGLTLGALAATAREDFRRPFSHRIYEAAFAPFPEAARGDVEVAEGLDAVKRLLRKGSPQGDAIGAVIVEPIQGRAGVRVPPPGFLSGLATLARDHGALLILDEIFTGLGRTGRFLALEHEDVKPDLVCLGKGLGGGLPLSACLGSASVMDAWPESQGEALHTSTFLGHPLACVAALGMLDRLAEDDLVRRAEDTGAWLLERLGETVSGLRCVSEVRGRGMFVGVELTLDRERCVPWSGGASVIVRSLLQKGVIALPAGAAGEVVELTPPLNISRRQLEFAVLALQAALEEERPDSAEESRS